MDMIRQMLTLTFRRFAVLLGSAALLCWAGVPAMSKGAAPAAQGAPAKNVPAMNAPTKNVPIEWCIVQRHSDQGRYAVYVTHDAAKVVSLQWGYRFIAKAPDWTVHSFRPEEKLEWMD